MAQKGRRRADQKLIIALACGATVESAARQAGICEATVYNRLKEPEFQAQLEAARHEMVTRTAASLTAASVEGVRTLLRLMAPSVPFPVQLGAAKAVIELGVKLRENSEIIDKITALQDQIAAGSA